MILLPAVLKAADRARRKAVRILAKQSSKRLREVTRRDALQVEDRQQRLDRPRAAHVPRKDRRREADARGIVGTGLSVPHTRLTYPDRADAGHHFALGQMAVADDAGSSVVGLERRMPGEELGHFGLDRLRQEIARPTAQDFGELIREGPWLNQLDNVIVRHGISLLRWRSEVVKQPHDMPPFRFAPSPTSALSSPAPPIVLHPLRDIRRVTSPSLFSVAHL